MEAGNDAQAIQGIRELAAGLAAYDETVEAWSLDIRFDLAEIILRHLKRLGWTRTKLAQRAGMYPAMLTKVLHSDQNWSVDTAARILHALGAKSTLIEVSLQPKEIAFSMGIEDGDKNKDTHCAEYFPKEIIRGRLAKTNGIAIDKSGYRSIKTTNNPQPHNAGSMG